MDVIKEASPWTASANASTESTLQAEVHEGLTIQLLPAPLLKRLLAYCVDWGILGLVTYVLVVGLAILATFLVPPAVMALEDILDDPQSASLLFIGLIALLLLLYICLIHGYFVYYHLKKGQTPGKRLFGLKLVSLSGEPLTRGQCLLREGFIYLDAGLIVPGLLSILVTQRGQRLGDLAAGTMVTHSSGSEQKDDYLYVTQEQYQLMKNVFHPRPIAPETANDFLRFAYPYFVTGRLSPTESELAQWELRVRSLLDNPDGLQAGRHSVLLFFAEHCFQSLRA